MKPFFLILIALIISTSLSASVDSLLNRIGVDLQFDPIEIRHSDGLQYSRNAYFLKMDKYDNLWIGSNAGLFYYDGISAKNYTNLVNRDSTIIQRDFVTDLQLDQEGNLWFGTTEGLYYIDINNRSCKKIAYPEGIDLYYVRTIACHGHEVLIGTYNGLYIYDRQKEKFIEEYFTDAELNNQNNIDPKIWFIYSNFLQHELWITTKSGLHFIDRLTKEIIQYKLPKPYAAPNNSFLEGYATADKFVIASYNDGLVEFDRKKRNFTQTNSGFESKGEHFNRFKSVIPLSNELIMANAEYIGIALYNSKTKKFRWVQSSELIQRGDYNVQLGNHGFVWLFTEGKLFRSNKVIANVTSIKDQKRELRLSRVMANGQFVIPNRNKYSNNLLFAETQRNLEFIFGIPFDFDSGSTSLEYRLDGNSWTNFQEIISLYNLKKGNHNLKIRALDEQGKIISEEEIKWNIHAPLLKRWYVLLGLLSTLLFSLLTIRHFILKKEREKKKMTIHYERKLQELESQALRSQINPHFIFNTLNSIKYYSIAKTPEETSDFISDFSLLIRQILENSKKNLIPLKDEIETIERYIRIENLRFKRHFGFSLTKDPEIIEMNFLIPPMIIQPFVENAIWHGLMHKDDDRELALIFEKTNKGICCIVKDNGIGREASKSRQHASAHKSSLGMQITQERLDILNNSLGMNNKFVIVDLVNKNGEAIGTEVKIYFETKT